MQISDNIAHIIANNVNIWFAIQKKTYTNATKNCANKKPQGLHLDGQKHCLHQQAQQVLWEIQNLNWDHYSQAVVLHQHPSWLWLQPARPCRVYKIFDNKKKQTENTFSFVPPGLSLLDGRSDLLIQFCRWGQVSFGFLDLLTVLCGPSPFSPWGRLLGLRLFFFFYKLIPHRSSQWNWDLCIHFLSCMMTKKTGVITIFTNQTILWMDIFQWNPKKPRSFFHFFKLCLAHSVPPRRLVLIVQFLGPVLIVLLGPHCFQH